VICDGGRRIAEVCGPARRWKPSPAVGKAAALWDDEEYRSDHRAPFGTRLVHTLLAGWLAERLPVTAMKGQQATVATT